MWNQLNQLYDHVLNMFNTPFYYTINGVLNLLIHKGSYNYIGHVHNNFQFSTRSFRLKGGDSPQCVTHRLA